MSGILTIAIKDQPFNKAIISGSLVERRIIKKTGFYADVLAPQRIEDMAVISHRGMARDGGVGGFGFSLSAEGVDRAEQHRQRLQRLTPHLCRALDASLRFGTPGRRQPAIGARTSIDAERRAAARQQAAYHPRQSGRRAAAARADGLTSFSNGGLCLSAVLPDERLALARSLAQAQRVADGSGDLLGEPLRVTRLSGAARCWSCRCRCRSGLSLWELTDTARLLVLVIDPGARILQPQRCCRPPSVDSRGGTRRDADRQRVERTAGRANARRFAGHREDASGALL